MGFLVFLGATTHNSTPTAFAAPGDLCEVAGPFVRDVHGQPKGLSEAGVMQVGETALVVARVENNSGRLGDIDVDLNSESGDADITSIIEEDDPYDYTEIDGSDHIRGNLIIELSNAGFNDSQLSNTLDNDIEDIFEDWENDFGFEVIGDVCGRDTIEELIADAIDSACDDDDEPTTTSTAQVAPGLNGSFDASSCFDDDAWDDLFQDDDITVRDIAALIAGLIAGGELECDDIAQAVGREIIGLSNDDEDDIEDDIFDLCAGVATSDGFDDYFDTWWDDLAIVDVTCYRAGIFDVSFAPKNDPANSILIEIVCVGDASDESTISARPNRVEIIPAMGNVSHSLITVELLDEDGEPAGAGIEVDFTTNRCTIETSGVDTWAEFDAADKVFRAYNINVAATAAAVEASAAAMAAVDSTRQADTVIAFDADGDSIAAAILGCGPSDTGGTVAAPGVATITAVIEVLDGQDIILSTTVTVVGPPADLKVTASPATLRCGEKATITATVKDSIGQNVSEHTRIEAVTNFGGVLGGTGAVAGSAGPVVPVSSTVAETFDGVATFYLLTSDAHVGPYEVVVTTGGAGSVTHELGGVFSTRPQVAQQTVTCTGDAPPAAPAPTISAPRTGTGSITPPSTGDAGLAADTTGASWALFSVIGAAAFAVAGLASLKVSRR